jgi:hypothetical protein
MLYPLSYGGDVLLFVGFQARTIRPSPVRCTESVDSLEKPTSLC